MKQGEFGKTLEASFDEVIAREGTDCEKFDLRERIFGREDVIPMWVADMDFAAPSEVAEAICRRASHPIYGYSWRTDSYYDSVIGWVQRHSGWQLQRPWLDFSPGVVAGLVVAMRAFTSEGDGVLIQPPVYHPFARQIRLNGRRVIENPLREGPDGRFVIDFEDLDRKLSDARAMILCNPHNPSGRVFTREELLQIGALCERHNVVILSDEIHCDLVFHPHQHLHIASLSEELARRTITFIAPSKTFNLAGLSTSVVIIADEMMRTRYMKEFNKLHADQGNLFGAVALETAYRCGDRWLEELLTYLGGNICYVLDFLKQYIPSVKALHPEGTYLMWLDFRAWGLPSEAVYRFLIDRAGVGVNHGAMFGTGGEGWMRVNIATQRSVVVRAMEQLRAAARAAGYCS